MTRKNILISTALLAALALSSACSATGGHQGTANAKKSPAPAPTCIGVLPVQAAVTSGARDRGLDTGIAVTDGILRDILGQGGKIRFIPSEQVQGIQLPGEIVKLEASREAARSVGCTALLETSLSRYVERDGGPYGVQQPAAVTVDYRLYNVNSGAVLCHGRFDEQQESLMENLFAIGKAGKRGITWRTAEELTREGLQSILTECRYLGK